MKTYKIVVQWLQTATLEIEANSLEEAKQKWLDGEGPEEGCGEYMQESIEINHDRTDKINS